MSSAEAGPSTGGWKLYARILAYLLPYKGKLGLVLLFNFLFILFNTLSIWMIAPFLSTCSYYNITLQYLYAIASYPQPHSTRYNCKY